MAKQKKSFVHRQKESIYQKNKWAILTLRHKLDITFLVYLHGVRKKLGLEDVLHKAFERNEKELWRAHVCHHCAVCQVWLSSGQLQYSIPNVVPYSTHTVLNIHNRENNI